MPRVLGELSRHPLLTAIVGACAGVAGTFLTASGQVRVVCETAGAAARPDAQPSSDEGGRPKETALLQPAAQALGSAAVAASWPPAAAIQMAASPSDVPIRAAISDIRTTAGNAGTGTATIHVQALKPGVSIHYNYGEYDDADGWMMTVEESGFNCPSGKDRLPKNLAASKREGRGTSDDSQETIVPTSGDLVIGAQFYCGRQGNLSLGQHASATIRLFVKDVTGVSREVDFNTPKLLNVSRP